MQVTKRIPTVYAGQANTSANPDPNIHTDQIDVCISKQISISGLSPSRGVKIDAWTCLIAEPSDSVPHPRKRKGSGGRRQKAEKQTDLPALPQPKKTPDSQHLTERISIPHESVEFIPKTARPEKRAHNKQVLQQPYFENTPDTGEKVHYLSTENVMEKSINPAVVDEHIRVVNIDRTPSAAATQFRAPVIEDEVVKSTDAQSASVASDSVIAYGKHMTKKPQNNFILGHSALHSSTTGNSEFHTATSPTNDMLTGVKLVGEVIESQQSAPLHDVLQYSDIKHLDERQVDSVENVGVNQDKARPLVPRRQPQQTPDIMQAAKSSDSTASLASLSRDSSDRLLPAREPSNPLKSADSKGKPSAYAPEDNWTPPRVSISSLHSAPPQVESFFQKQQVSSNRQSIPQPRRLSPVALAPEPRMQSVGKITPIIENQAELLPSQHTLTLTSSLEAATTLRSKNLSWPMGQTTSLKKLAVDSTFKSPNDGQLTPRHSIDSHEGAPYVSPQVQSIPDQVKYQASATAGPISPPIRQLSLHAHTELSHQHGVDRPDKATRLSVQSMDLPNDEEHQIPKDLPVKYTVPQGFELYAVTSTSFLSRPEAETFGAQHTRIPHSVSESSHSMGWESDPVAGLLNTLAKVPPPPRSASLRSLLQQNPRVSEAIQEQDALIASTIARLSRATLSRTASMRRLEQFDEVPAKSMSPFRRLGRCFPRLKRSRSQTMPSMMPRETEFTQRSLYEITVSEKPQQPQSHSERIDQSKQEEVVSSGAQEHTVTSGDDVNPTFKPDTLRYSISQREPSPKVGCFQRLCSSKNTTDNQDEQPELGHEQSLRESGSYHPPEIPVDAAPTESDPKSADSSREKTSSIILQESVGPRSKVSIRSGSLKETEWMETRQKSRSCMPNCGSSKQTRPPSINRQNSQVTSDIRSPGVPLPPNYHTSDPNRNRYSLLTENPSTRVSSIRMDIDDRGLNRSEPISNQENIYDPKSEPHSPPSQVQLPPVILTPRTSASSALVASLVGLETADRISNKSEPLENHENMQEQRKDSLGYPSPGRSSLPIPSPRASMTSNRILSMRIEPMGGNPSKLEAAEDERTPPTSCSPCSLNRKRANSVKRSTIQSAPDNNLQGSAQPEPSQVTTVTMSEQPSNSTAKTSSEDLNKIKLTHITKEFTNRHVKWDWRQNAVSTNDPPLTGQTEMSDVSEVYREEIIITDRQQVPQFDELTRSSGYFSNAPSSKQSENSRKL